MSVQMSVVISHYIPFVPRVARCQKGSKLSSTDVSFFLSLSYDIIMGYFG